MLPKERATRLGDFLNRAALCGDNVPANLILHSQGLSVEEQDTLVDFIDEKLVEGGPIPIFRSYEYRHPSFPTQAIYGFLNPLYPGAILARLSRRERADLASQLLASQKATLPVSTRGSARLVLAWARHLGDEGQCRAYETELAWWIGQDEADALTRYLADAVQHRRMEPQFL